MSVIKIPANVGDLKKTLSNAFNKKPGEVAPKKEESEEAKRRAGSDAAKHRTRAKELATQLNDVKLTVEEKQKIIDGIAAQNEALQAELDDYKAKVEDLNPKAKKWSDFEHKERQKLIQSFPPEEQKDAKSIAESMDIDTFRKYTARITGAGKSTEQPKDGGKGAWGKLVEDSYVSEEGMKKLDEAIQKDPKGYDTFRSEKKE